jgi:NADH-quinone oxidoreductase subunit J
MINQVALIIIAALIIGCALAAALNPKLMHAALAFALAFVGVSALFFWLGAEFVGMVQIFVYIGAVAVLVVFTILLTRRDREDRQRGFNWSGVVVALAVFAGLVWTILKTPTMSILPPEISPLTVKRIGEVLMSDYIWPLTGVGVLLAVALLGALILAMEEKRE